MQFQRIVCVCTGNICRRSYCQIWCMRKKLGGFPAELAFVYAVDELDAVDDVGELLEAA